MLKKFSFSSCLNTQKKIFISWIWNFFWCFLLLPLLLFFFFSFLFAFIVSLPIPFPLWPCFCNRLTFTKRYETHRIGKKGQLEARASGIDCEIQSFYIIFLSSPPFVLQTSLVFLSFCVYLEMCVYHARVVHGWMCLWLYFMEGFIKCYIKNTLLF